MKTHLRLTLALLPLSLAASLFAQTPADAGSRRGGPGRGASLIVRVLDTDRDRELSAAEIANAPVTLHGLDADGDDIISSDELRPTRPGSPKGRSAEATVRPVSASLRSRPLDPVMLALDANLDDALAAAEIANAATSLAALDLDHNGKLTADELRPLAPEAQ